MTYEVRLSRPFIEGGLGLNAADLLDDDGAAIKYWFKEELDWCKERGIAVITELRTREWICPSREQINDIILYGTTWPGPPVQFTFEDDDAALLFRLVWG